MKRSNWVRLLAVILVISMMVGPVSAVTVRSGEGYRQNALGGSLIGRIRDIVRDIIDDWFDEPIPGKPISPKPTVPGTPEEPTTPVDPSEPVDTTDPTNPEEPADPTEPEAPEVELELVEGYNNTENGQLLRGQTYTLSQVIAQQKPQNPISHIGLRKPISILPGNPIGGLSTNAVVTTDADDAVQSTKIEGITGEANSYDVGEGAVASNAFDGNVNTYWATAAGGNVANCYLIADLGGEYTIDKVVYTKRVSGGSYNCTGNLNDYIIEIRNGADGAWQEVTSGSTNANGSTEITFTAVQATHVRLRTTSTYHWQMGQSGHPDNRNTVMTCAEFEVFGVKVAEPEVPALNLTVTARYSTNRLSWNAQTGVTYTVERSSDNVTWTELGTATTGSYLDETAGKGTQYFYRVTANGVSSEGVNGLVTGMNALKAIAVLFYAGNDETTFDGTNKVEIATGDKATQLNAMQSGTIIYKANPSTISGIQAVLGTDNSKYVGVKNSAFRHELGGLTGQHQTAIVNANEDNTAGFTYDDSNGYWFMSSNGSTMNPIDLVEANFGLLTDVNATTYYAGGGGNNSFNGTINYIIILNEVLTNAEMSALTGANADHDAENAQPDPTDPVEPENPTVGESIYWNNLTWKQVKEANYTYYADDRCTNAVEVVEKDDGTYELVDASGNVLATGTNLTDRIGYMLHTPSYVVFFPVTMYDYDQPTINAATHALEAAANPDLTKWQGIYFNGGTPAAITYGNDINWVDGGKYYIQNCRGNANNTEGKSWLQAHSENKIFADTKENATLWTLNIEDGKYYLSCDINGVTNYLLVGTGPDNDGYTTTKTPIELVNYTASDYEDAVQLKQNGYHLCQWGGVAVQDFGGYNVANDPGNAMWFYLVTDDGEQKMEAPDGITAGFADWNFWGKNSGNNANGDLFYTGLVQPELVNDQLVFTKPDGGIFNNDTSVKDIYNFVGVPFVLNTEYGVYTFDSDVNGAYFNGTPASGTATAPNNLHFALEAPQPMPNGLSVGDGSTNAFLPYNNQSSYNTGDVNYHFGMRADLPFSMTTNGRVKSTDDTSRPITFTFSGDDDVWIFIDGKLVADLGGIHNRLDITMDFAANTITYFEENADDGDNNTGSYNDNQFATVQKLFNDTEGTGLLNMTRNEFAATQNHVMQFFYLERGEGTSNCHIEFNLPMLDSVMVTKDITKSWSEAQDEEDGENGDGTAPLTAKEQAAIDKLDFDFRLYKKVASGEFEAVCNTNFYLLDKNGNVLGIQATGPDGRFSLKNGQTAKFVTDIHRSGITYYVEELDLDLTTFLTPDYNYRGLATNGFNFVGEALDPDSDEENATKPMSGSYPDASMIPEHELPMNAKVLKSYDVTAFGSIESIDTLQFICTNYLNAELPNPTARAYEDIIVIDYGLEVQIDPLANDVYRGDALRILYWGDENLTLEGYKEAEQNGTLTAPKTEYHSGTLEFVAGLQNEEGVVRDTFNYKLNKQLTEVEVITYIIESASYANDGQIVTDYSVGKIYIVPATIMYYEENFANMITFEGAAWYPADDEKNTSNAANLSPFQEPGVVGTVDDSTYGSDVAYLNDNGDSNGTIRYADTSNKAARFTYTFTGTGTTIFARTSANTGYIQVKVFKGTDTTAKDYEVYYVDTYWKDETKSDLTASGTLYNIPVFTREDLAYGTYTVVCTVAKAGTATNGNPNGAGNEFYLDGIRVMQPLNKDADEALTTKALDAYATDGESNLETVTLRDKLIFDQAEWSEDKFAVMTDINGQIVSAQDYINIGPHEEVYLAPGQKVTFSLETWQPEGLKLYMGMKAPFGDGDLTEVNVGHVSIPLYNAPDCYYDVTDDYDSLVPVKDADGNITSYIVTYTFEGSSGVVSLTNIKVVGNYQFVIIPQNP